MTDTQPAVALVTGASRGVGRGIAAALSDSGMRVFASGRTIDQAELPSGVERVVCDHTDDDAVARLFARIDADGGRLDVLVNSAWGGYERMVEDGRFTWGAPFWEQPRWRWDAMITAGVRSAFVASQFAARIMVPERRGLIVNIALGSTEAPRQHDLWHRQSGNRQADERHSSRAAPLQRDGGVVVSGTGSHRSSSHRRSVRSQQLGESGVQRSRYRRPRCRS